LWLSAIAGGWIILKVDKDAQLEARKVRFAAATFTGIMFLFVFIATLYFAGENSSKEIFEKGVTAMFTLAGSIVGYLFGTSRSTEATLKPEKPPGRDT
jgi:cytochrome bd-type quinol oxidase subunit 2